MTALSPALDKLSTPCDAWGCAAGGRPEPALLDKTADTALSDRYYPTGFAPFEKMTDSLWGDSGRRLGAGSCDHPRVHVRAVPGEHLLLGVDEVHGVVHRRADFAEAGRDQLELA